MSQRLGRRMPADRRKARPVVVAALAALSFTPFAVPADATPPVEPPAESGPVDEAKASAAARSSGVRVEVTTKRSEHETLYANPDGTWTLDLTTEAVRVRRGDGWAPVDTTLVRRADGSVAPVATTADMTFSGGGTGPLATVRRDGKSIAMSFGTPLPAPTLEGAAATYAEVLPGVDLVVTAGVGGFTEVLVVKTREAAANPALRKITFPVRTSGVALKDTAGGGFAAVDADGDPVFVSPEATMWDSRGSNGNRLTGWRDGDKIAAMRSEVGPASVAVVPDARLLTGPDTVFPVYLDPPVMNATQIARAMVDESYPTNEYYQWTGDQGVGYQNFSGVSKKRQFHSFGTSTLAGKTIHSATFSAFETHAATCTPTEVLLYHTGPFSSATNWNAQPTWGSLLDRKTVAHGRDGCDPLGATVEFDATNAVKSAAAAGSGSVSLGLKATSETNSSYWKRFRYDTKLSVTYNNDPGIPTALRIVSPPSACGTGTAPKFISDVTPTVGAKASDVDGGNLYMDFEWGEVGAARYWARTTTAKASGLEHTATIPFGGTPGPAFVHGKTYSFRARSYDGYDLSNFSPVCDFTIDTVRPAAKPLVTSVDFPEGDTQTSESPTVVVGQEGWFTVEPGKDANGVTVDSDIDYYKVSFDNANYSAPYGGTANPGTLNGPAAIKFVPSQAGVHFMLVRAYDRAGNVSDETRYYFRVANQAPNGRWRFDEGTGLTSDDSAPTTTTGLEGTRDAALPATGVTWGDGAWFDPEFDPGDKALAFDGTTAAQTASGSVDTSKPFTLGLWVHLDKPDTEVTRYIALSQNSVNTSAYQLGYENGKWFFRMALDDSGTTGWTWAYQPAAGTTQQWTHLTAIYDGMQIRLYVDGVDANPNDATDKATFVSDFTSSGPVRFGQGRSANTWVGKIDEAVTYPGVRGPDDVLRLATQPHAQS